MELHFWHHLIKGQPWPTTAVQLPQYQAHRGYHSKEFQENTLQAFRKAKLEGLEMCECDIQLSSDGIPIIFHDEDLLRLGGFRDKVCDLTAKELKEKAYAPTLTEILTDQECPEQWNLEIKSKKFNDPLFKKVFTVLKEQKAENRVLISSFNPMALVYFSKVLPSVPRALLVTEKLAPNNHFYLKKMLLAPLIEIHMLNLEQSMIDKETVQFWKKQGLPIGAWTIKSKIQGHNLLDLGVKSLICDPE